MKKFLNFMFNFGKKYRDREEKYHKDSAKHGRSGELVTIVLYTLLPILSILGIRFLPWSDTGWLVALKIFCFLGGFSIFFAPSELMITGIVALRHRAKMKIYNKVENTIVDSIENALNENSEEKVEKVEREERVAKGTAYKYDLVVGILGIVCAALVLVTTIVLLTSFFWADINKLN